MQRETWQQHFFPPSQTRERLHLTSSLQEVWSLDLRSYLWVFHKHSGEQEVAGEQLSPSVSNGCSQPRCNTIKVKRVMVKELIYICLSRLSRLFFVVAAFPPSSLQQEKKSFLFARWSSLIVPYFDDRKNYNYCDEMRETKIQLPEKNLRMHSWKINV